MVDKFRVQPKGAAKFNSMGWVNEPKPQSTPMRVEEILVTLLIMVVIITAGALLLPVL
jgi:hypothetical protein